MERIERDPTYSETDFGALARAASRPILLGFFCGLSSAGLLGLLLLRGGWSEAASLSLCLVAGFLMGAAAVAVYGLVCLVRGPESAGPALLGGALFIVLAAVLLVSGVVRSTEPGSGIYPVAVVLSFPALAALLWRPRGPRERSRGPRRRQWVPGLANFASSLHRRL